MDKDLEEFIKFYKENTIHTAKGLIKKLLPQIEKYLDSGMSLRHFTIEILQNKYGIKISYKTVAKWYNHFNKNESYNKINVKKTENIGTQEIDDKKEYKSPLDMLKLKKIKGANE